MYALSSTYAFLRIVLKVVRLIRIAKYFGDSGQVVFSVSYIIYLCIEWILADLT